MNTTHKPPRSPALRLKWLEAISPPQRAQTYPRNYLIGIGLGLMLTTIVGVGVIIGIVGTEPIAQYVRQILELAWRDRC